MSNEKTGWAEVESFDDVDLNEAVKPPPPIEPGVYRAQTEDATLDISSKGKPVITHKFTLLHKYGDSTPLNRSMRADKVPMQKKTAFRWAALCLALGLGKPKATPDGLEQFAYDVKDAGKNGFWVEIAEEPYTDKNSGEQRMGTVVRRYLTAAEAEQSTKKADIISLLDQPKAAKEEPPARVKRAR